MSKFTGFVLVLIAVIVLMFTGIIVAERQNAVKDFETEQKEAIPESVDEKTTKKAEEVKKSAQETTDGVLADLDDSKKDLVSEYGDTVTIDYVGIQDGKEFDGGTSTDYDLEIGSNSFITGFEVQLEDHKIGDVVEVKVTFPEDYSSTDLAGKDALFIVTIKDIKKA